MGRVPGTIKIIIAALSLVYCKASEGSRVRECGLDERSQADSAVSTIPVIEALQTRPGGPFELALCPLCYNKPVSGRRGR